MSESNQTEIHKHRTGRGHRMWHRMWQRMRGFTVGPVVLILLGLILLSGLIRSRVAADEGMWTFDHPPLRQWKEKYGFEPKGEWLDHLRLSTVRLSEGAGGGTGCLVSADGLVMTNQHVGRGQVAK
ncbi:MAG: S46 family peptidase, partial [Blastocatellia bacterium]